MTAQTVNTVLGPVPADELGVVAVHEALLSVLPGALLDPRIPFDRAAVFDAIAGELAAFKAAGGGTVVDATGMFHGRDLPLLEALSRTSGVHVVASTGMGPEELLGGYFLTPQTNPPTPWPAEKFAELFAAEVSEGMVVPRLERRGRAGLVTTTATRGGRTATDESLIRGAARAGLATGAPVSIRYGEDAMAELALALSEGIPAGRVAVAGLDRRDAVAAGAPAAVAAAGAYVLIDHVGRVGDDLLDDAERAALVAELVAAGHAERILLASGATGVAVGLPAVDTPFEHVLTSFAPRLLEAGVPAGEVDRILVANPARLLAIAPKEH